MCVKTREWRNRSMNADLLCAVEEVKENGEKNNQYYFEFKLF